MWVYGGAPVRYGLSGTSSLCYLLRCVSVALDDIYFGAGLECAPGSVQPIIHMKDGERQMGERDGDSNYLIVFYSMRVQTTWR
jgi:hypothetical protein